MIPDTFDLSGRTAVVTGGYGVLGGGIARSLAAAGVRVAIWGRRPDAAAALVDGIRGAGGEVMVVQVDVLNEEQVRRATQQVVDAWERIDILVNAAGGNVARARSDSRPVFQVPLDAFDEALQLNLHGTVVPTVIVGEVMARQGRGSIVNISSMAAIQAISGVMGYSVAKAGVDNLTRWLAADLARRHGAGLRVNAVAPGFFVTTQNRAVLINADGTYSERARRIVDRTPMGRFGEADELYGAIHWLCSDAASFVTGAIIPVDGGFQAFSGI